MEDDALERAVLSAVDAAGASTVDTAELAERLGVDHTRVVGVVKSLEAYNLITAQARARALGPSCRDPGRSRARRRPSPHLTHPCCHCTRAQTVEHSAWALTEEGAGYLEAGTPEAAVFAAVPPEGVTLAQLKARGRSSSTPHLHAQRPRARVGHFAAPQLRQRAPHTRRVHSSAARTPASAHSPPPLVRAHRSACAGAWAAAWAGVNWRTWASSRRCS